VTDSVIDILLIDDDAGYAGVAKSYLKTLNGKSFNLVWIEDAGKALAYLKAPNDIRLILMAHHLRDRNGLEVLREIRDAEIRLPVIMLTGGKDFRVAIEAMKFGVAEYLVKEEAVDTLFPRTIVSVLEEHELKTRVATAEQNRIISQKKTEAIQELVVTMCHEFNNPLAAIKISTDILNRQCKVPAVKAILSDLDKSITKLEKQIVKLRDLDLPVPGAG
jgi:two-component system cell cycle sensor histidine kinase/response regulator CckA